MALAKRIQRIVNTVGNSSGFDKLLHGMKVVSAQPGKLQMEMQVKPEHLNTAGTLHGGMIMTLAGDVSTLAIFSVKEGKLGVSVDLNVSFLAAAYSGEKITIESEVLRAGKTLAYANVNILKEGGKVIATGSHTKYMEIGYEFLESKL